MYPPDGADVSINNGYPENTSFHGCPAFYESLSEEAATQFAWDMDGWEFYLYVYYAERFMEYVDTPDVYPYTDALHDVYWNVVQGVSGSESPLPEPDEQPSD